MDLLAYLKKITSISAAAEEGMVNSFRKLEYPRKHHLCKQGQIVTQLYYIQSGLVRMYYINKQGKDVTYGFYTEQQFVTVPDSFFGHMVSRYYLELLEDCVLYAVTYNDLVRLRGAHTEVQLVENHVLRDLLLKVSDRIVALQFLSAEERYTKLEESQPSILQRAPLGAIASYLGITQETLSRIRARRLA
jgi:CRP-like cAMP-binding protein